MKKRRPIPLRINFVEKCGQDAVNIIKTAVANCKIRPQKADLATAVLVLYGARKGITDKRYNTPKRAQKFIIQQKATLEFDPNIPGITEQQFIEYANSLKSAAEITLDNEDKLRAYFVFIGLLLDEKDERYNSPLKALSFLTTPGFYGGMKDKLFVSYN